MQPSADPHGPSTLPPQAGERPYAHALAHDQRRARKPFTDRRFSRSRSDRLIGGVCGGVAAFVGFGSTSVRLVYALSVLLSLGTTAVLYLLLWLLIPAEPVGGA